MRLIDNLSIQLLKKYVGSLKKEWDVFVTCGSFEDRCIRSSEIFLKYKVSIEKSIIFNFKESDPRNNKEKNIKNMISNLKQVSELIYVFKKASVSYPSKGIKKFINFLKEKDIILNDKTIVIDITVFPKRYFFLLIKVLKELYGLEEYHVIYTEPEKYKSAVKGEIILTEGLDRVESIPGFNGSCINSKDALIVILGFEGKRSMEVFNTVNPDYTYAINGFPSFQPGWHKFSLEANLQFLKVSRARENLFFAPALDPFVTKEVISRIVEEIKEKDSDTNIIIAPLGSKPMAFGTLLYALKYKYIKVIYPFPSVYKADYSYKYGPSRIFKVNLKVLI